MIGRAARWALVAPAAAAIGLTSSGETFAHKPTVTKFTYHEDVYPIFEAKCGSCHRSGGVAPMSLLTYEEAYPWAVSIKNEILHLAMPPWFADERSGSFRHREDTALTAVEMNTIVDWCLGGSPEGEPSSGAATPGSVIDGWPMGEPDLVVEMPEPFTLSADENEAIHVVSLDAGLSQPRFVTSVDFRPGSGNVVRSAMVFAGAGGDSGRGSLLGVWIPGRPPEPAEIGYALAAGAPIVLRLHYKKTWLDEGSVVEDRSRLALYFHDGAPPRLATSLALGPDAESEATSTGFVRRAGRSLDGGGEVHGFAPLLGAKLGGVLVEAVRPDGSRQPLIRLHEPSPDWPRKYWLTKPLSLPPGSRLEVELTAKDPEPLEAEHEVFVDVVPS